MSSKTITVHVKMDYKTLRSFSMFDTFLLKKRGVRPLIFGAIFLFFAIICFAATDKEQNWLLGTVMLLIAVGMPSVYVGFFLSQVKGLAKKLKLNPPRAVYTLAFNDQQVTIRNDLKQEDTVELPWDHIAAAFRVKKAIYLYATPMKAFILPDGQADATPDELWAMMVKKLPEGRARVKKF